jgi:hypothetical protein
MMFNWTRGFSRFFQKSKAPIRNAPRPRRVGFRPCVEMLEDRRVPTTFTVTDPGDTSGAGVFTLREAIHEVNTSTVTLIQFNISGGGVHVIAPATPYETIAHTVTINGFSQGVSTTPLIQLQGPSGNDFDGLRLGAGSGGSVIEGLAIDGFGVAGIEVDSNSNTIQGNFIGTNPAGNTTSATLANFDGVLIFNANGNGILGNLISGNNVGVVIAADGGTGGVGNGVSSGNLVQGNFIGTDVTGATALGNTNEGVLIQGGDSPSTVTGVTDGNADGNLVGGVDTVTGRTLGGQAGNLISGNGAQGVTIFQATAGSKASGNLVEGNYIGTNAGGTSAVVNTGDGVRIDAAASNTVGGTVAGTANLLSGNGGGFGAGQSNLNGVLIDQAGASGNLVEGTTSVPTLPER